MNIISNRMDKGEWKKKQKRCELMEKAPTRKSNMTDPVGFWNQISFFFKI